jgi:universal stress protein F
MNRILVALDHSPRALKVLARAESIARVMNAELFLLRTVGLPVEVPMDAFRTSPNDMVERWRAQEVRELERLALTLDPKQVTHILVRVGSPWAAICASAKEHDVDLIVIGSHGYDVVDHVVGTTAAKVVNHADRSVLVVREVQHRA